MYIYMWTILAYLRDSLIRQVVIYTMDYLDVATTIVLAPEILPVDDLRNMLKYIESELLSTIYLPISLDNTLHFYQNLSKHIVIVDRQFLLLSDMSIQNRAQQLQIYEIFSLPVPHSNLSAQYNINHKYIGVTYGEIKAVAITHLQYRACQHANREVCWRKAPYQPLTNLPSCVTTIYAKMTKQ